MRQNKNYHDGVLNELRNCLSDGKLVWLTGDKETGKTRLCKELAATVSDSCYVDCRNYTETEFGQVDQMLSGLLEKHSLIILDHYDNAKTISPFREIQKEFYNREATLIVVSRKELLSYPLFSMEFFCNDFNKRITLDSIPMEQCDEFFPGLTTREQVVNYAVHGGMPYVLSLMSGKKTLRENIIELLKISDLWNEHVLSGIDITKRKLSEDILCAMADGSESIKELSEKLQVSYDEIKSTVSLLEGEGIIKQMEGFNFGCCKICKLERWELANQSYCFLFRFLYGDDIGTDAEKYYESEIEPFLEKFAEDSWHRWYYRGSDNYKMIYGRKEAGRRVVKVNIRISKKFENERYFPIDLTFCDFRLGEVDEDSEEDMFWEKTEYFHNHNVIIGHELVMPEYSRMIIQ